VFGWRRSESFDFPEDWQFYTRSKGTRPEALTVNLELKAHAPPLGEWTLVKLATSLHRPTEDGLMSTEEAPAISAWEDRLISKEMMARGVVPVAVCTAGGTNSVYFYMRDAKVFDRLLREVLPPDTNYEFEVFTRPDRNWSYYLQSLYPDADGLKQIEDYKAASVEIDRAAACGLAVIQTLNEKGDATEVPRPIDFTLLFPSAGVAEEFANWARSWDYENVRVGPSNASGGFQSVVSMSMVLPADFSLIHSRERVLIQKAMKLRGKYDGWGTFHQSKETSREEA
jgi:hypothetical protein